MLTDCLIREVYPLHTAITSIDYTGDGYQGIRVIHDGMTSAFDTGDLAVDSFRYNQFMESERGVDHSWKEKINSLAYELVYLNPETRFFYTPEELAQLRKYNSGLSEEQREAIMFEYSYDFGDREYTINDGPVLEDAYFIPVGMGITCYRDLKSWVEMYTKRSPAPKEA